MRRAGRPPRRRALPGAVRHDGAHAAVRRRGAGAGAPLAEPDKGSGIAMICTFGDLTDVIWWRELDLPTRSVIGRDGRLRAGHAALAGRRARRVGVRRARRHDDVLGPRSGSWSCCAASGDLDGEPTPDPADGQVLREGRQAAGDRHDPAVVHPQRRPGRRTCASRCSTAARARLACRTYMRHRYENWVDGPQRRLADQPAAVLRRPVPGLVPRSTRTASPTTTTRCSPAEDHAAGRPVVAGARPATPRTSAASRAASSATRT